MNSKNLIILYFLLHACFSIAQDLKKNEFSISAGYWFIGEMYADYYVQYYEVGGTILTRAEFNHYFSVMNSRFGIGSYYNLAFPFYSYAFNHITMHEFGLVLKTRFNLSERLLIKPGVYAGYRLYGAGAGEGLGVNGSITLQYLGGKIKPFIDAGILTQPAGGDTYTNYFFGPQILISLGVSF